jgi:6,7-dimethyl-8-ribityllumazine synthase
MTAHESWPGEDPEHEPVEDQAAADEPENEEGWGEDDVEPEGEAAPDGDDEDTDGELEPAAEAEPIERDASTELDIPDDVDALEGEVRSTHRGVGLVVSRANVEVGNRMLESALDELDRVGVGREQVLVMAVPGPFELPIGAMALAKTRRYACIVALGDATASAIVAGESASGLQLAGLETGVPIAFGVLTDDADPEERGAEAVRTALEMADLFHQLRSAAKAG